MAGTVPANPFFPTLMPAVDFPGADAGVVWNDFSPRLGMTYDLTGDGRNVLSSSYSTYYGQMAPGQLSSELAATGAVFVRYPWNDANGDGFVQVHGSQLRRCRSCAKSQRTIRPTRPTPVRPTASIRTSRTIGRASSSSASIVSSAATWRWAPATSGASTIGSSGTIVINFTSADYRAVTFQPDDLPGGRALRSRSPTSSRTSDSVAEHLHERAGSVAGLSTASS